MNEEQTMPASDSEAEDKSRTNETNASQTSDDYYSVDDPKKPVSTTIGDGEMHNEGLVGDGSVTNSESTVPGGSTNEQDEAENHDSEG